MNGKRALTKIVEAPILGYKKISPLKGYRCCKYYPSCSDYALTAIEEKGVVKGFIMSAWRILRCNPFSKGGFDPVR